jgi:hypothetical protein
MTLLFRTRRRGKVCGQTRIRPLGYRLRCLEPSGHDGEHRWTPELVDVAVSRG